MTVFCHCTYLFLHLAFMCVFMVVHVYYVWPYVLLIVPVYVISVLGLLIVLFCHLVSVELFFRYYILLHMIYGSYHYSTHFQYVYFVGPVIVLIITMISDHIMYGVCLLLF